MHRDVDGSNTFLLVPYHCLQKTSRFNAVLSHRIFLLRGTKAWRAKVGSKAKSRRIGPQSFSNIKWESAERMQEQVKRASQGERVPDWPSRGGLKCQNKQF